MLLETNTGGGNPTEYVFFNGTRVARRDPSGSVFYYFEDHLSTSRVIADANGTKCYDADFYPFGGERVITDTCPQPYKFTGQERDVETGLDYFVARHYANSLARFMSVDPLQESAKLLEPQTWNKFSYVGNNPLRFFDPNGLEKIEAVANRLPRNQKVRIGTGSRTIFVPRGDPGFVIPLTNGRDTGGLFSIQHFENRGFVGVDISVVFFQLEQVTIIDTATGEVTTETRLTDGVLKIEDNPSIGLIFSDRLPGTATLFGRDPNSLAFVQLQANALSVDQLRAIRDRARGISSLEALVESIQAELRRRREEEERRERELE